MDIESALEEIGLSHNEASMYLALLKLGTAKASDIAKKNSSGRGGAYYILKILKQKGFITETIKSGVLYYNAVSADTIFQIIRDEQYKKENALKNIISDLKKLESTNLERPIVESYEGYEGFKTAFNRVLELPGKDIKCYLSSQMLEFMPYFHEQFRKRRVEKKIKIRTLTEKTPSLTNIKKLDKKELRQTKFLNEIFKGTNILYYIMDEEILIIRANTNEQFALRIKDKEVARLHSNIFELLWKNHSL
ncbi:MAG: TrmB family transcriptional regulator [Candidatus Woesearchaeota archaeon]